MSINFKRKYSEPEPAECSFSGVDRQNNTSKSSPVRRFCKSAMPDLSSPRLSAFIAIALFAIFVGTSVDAAVKGKPSHYRDSASSGEIDGKSASSLYTNEIINNPIITCGYGIVNFDVLTTNGNASVVYVRGQSSNPDCVFHNTRNVTIDLSKCNIRRKREVNPIGVAYQMTVIVQLHPLFVTKVDRAYNVNCFYMEQRQDVSVDFNVSELATQAVQADAILPACTYSVHRDSPNGPKVKYTRVGEQLYHVWECKSTMYSMLLYNCMAVDGKGAEHPIIDENGCSEDEFLMPQITYTAEKTKAMAASAAFNFPDRNTMSFACKIKLCYSSDAECNHITPPTCNGKRSKAVGGNFNEDVETTVDYTRSTEQASNTTLSSHESDSTSNPTTVDLPTEVEVERNQGKSSEKKEEDLETSEPVPKYRPTSAPSSEWTMTVIHDQTTPNSGSEEQDTTEEAILTITTEKRSTTQLTTKTTTEAQRSAYKEETTSSVPVTTKSTKKSTEKLPEDFPRPDFLLLKDQTKQIRVTESQHAVTSSTERVEKEGSGEETVIDSHKPNSREAAVVATTGAASREESQEDDRYQGTTAVPVKILKKGGGGVTKPPTQAGRAQRDTTTGTDKGGKKGSRSTVDIDIVSPDLTILDDYEPSAAAQKGSNQRGGASLDQESAPFIDWASERSATASDGVCFSSAALIVVASLVTVLAVTVMIILYKSRKGFGGNYGNHSFYSS